MQLIKRAASYPLVERILVNPGIKKKLCDTVTGNRAWLRKVRPFWGHDYHMHVRIGCQPGSPAARAGRCRPGRRLRQVAGLVVHRRAVAPQQEPGRAQGARHHETVSAAGGLRAVLDAPSPVNEAAVTVRGRGQAPMLAQQPAEAPVTANAFSGDIPLDRPVPPPMFRPEPRRISHFSFQSRSRLAIAEIGI
jgi:penicillin-insensitive murein endopeptidase